MNHEDTPASEPRVIERHALLVQFTLDERGRIGFSVTPERAVIETHGASCLELARQGAPFTRVAAALLTAELERHLMVAALERTEMRFRRAGRWEEVIRPVADGPSLTEAAAEVDDCVH